MKFLKKMMKGLLRVYLLVDTAVGWAVVDEDTDDVYISPPGSQVQREATFAVRHICGCLKLEQFQHHLPEREAGTQISIH